MTEWIDVTVYAALMLILWFVLPSVNARFIVPVIEDRNAGWLADHREALQRLTRVGWFQWLSYALGTLSIATLVAAQTGAWPEALSAPGFEPERWMVLSDVFTALVLLWLIHFGTGSAVFTRWLKKEVPLSTRRQATLERRSVARFVARPIRIAVYSALALHLGAWLVVGLLDRNSSATFGGMLAFQVVITAIVVFIAHRMAERKPGAMDRIYGPAFRRTEVQFAFMAQLFILVNGSLRLYEQATGTVLLDFDRAARLILVVFMIAGAVVGLLRFTWPTRGGSDREAARAASRGAWALLALLGSIAAPAAAAAQSSVPALPPDSTIRRILADRVETHRQTMGIVVGIIDPSGRRVIAHGRRAANDSRPLDGDTVFELASITKAFTSLLLADALQRGEVSLSDPVSRYLPSHVKVPSRGGRQITLVDLATHMSGLPREPSNLQPKDPANPFVDYSVDLLYAFLSSHQLARDIGTEYEYSSLGAGLLGHVLALRAGTDYGTLVRTRIAAPLGMTDTDVAFSSGMRSRLATGHNRAGDPVPNWDSPTLAGAGALRSTANDMLRLLAAVLGYETSPLAAALATMTGTRRPTGSPVFEIGLGWGILADRGTEIAFANGRSGGYRTWIGFEPHHRTGVVVLTNTDSPVAPDDIGMHLLNPKFPLTQSFPQPMTQRQHTTVDPAIFDRYVGRYQFAPAVHLTVSRDGGRFIGQLTGQPPVEMFAESETSFFLKAVDAQFTFEVDGTNQATAVRLHQNGAVQRAPRIEGEAVMPTEITLSADVLDRYVGRYQVAPGVLLTITRKETRLFAQVPGAPALEAFASGEREFFHKAVDVQLTFELDANGRAVAVLVRQAGTNLRASRIE